MIMARFDESAVQMKVWLYLVVCLIVLLGLAAAAPYALSDNHRFLKEFVGSDYLSFMGLILTITVASLSQLHFSINQFEERLGTKLPIAVRKEIFSNVRWLLSLFAFSFAIVLFKPMSADSAASQSIFNGAALITIILYFLILIDITQAIFLFEPTEAELQSDRASNEKK
jgi:hypothetical protein